MFYYGGKCMILSGLFSLLAKIFFFTGKIETKNAFEKPLSSEEEKKYFMLMKQGDASAEEILIRHNLRLVAHIAKKYKNSSIDIDDLISIGSIGLMKSIKTFSYDKGNNFSTYASRCIENEILMTFRSDKKNANSVYLDDVISVDKDGNNLSLYEIFKDNSVCVESQVENSILYKKIERIILKKLSSREREIIVKRYGLCGTTPKTQIELAEELKISRSYISRLEKKALSILKTECELNKL
jgi:RNA polymerase sporulation-specific sigma factor